MFASLRVTLCAALVFGAGVVQAQQGQLSGPTEPPPADFSGNEYVDSQGCAFVRGGFGTSTVWLPRVDPSRGPVCGLTPSVAPAAVAEVPPAEPTTAGATEADPAVEAAAPPAPAVAPAEPRRNRSASGRAPAAATVVLTSVDTLDAVATRCPPAFRSAERFTLSDGRRVIRCGGPVADANAFLAAHGYLGGAAGARYVQIGAFAVPDNAERSRARLRAMGLPVSNSTLHRRGGDLAVVLAGPFEDPGARDRAWAALRAAGYPDAFLR